MQHSLRRDFLAVETLKAPKKGRCSKADGIVPGQRFIVHAGGKRSFRLIARINGKQENLKMVTPPC